MRLESMFRCILWLAALATTFGVSVARAGSDPKIDLRVTRPTARLVSEAKEKWLRSQLPKVNDENVQRILDDPQLIFYSDEEIPPAYQDWSSGLPGVHSPRYNISADAGEPYGNGNVEFPWGDPGGTHRTAEVSTFRFLWLPVDEQGRRWPIVWYRQWLSGSSSRGYAWTFPVGAVVGEVLRMRSPTGDLVTFELRLRIREYGEWVVDVFRPFPTNDHLVQRIKELRPQWSDHPKLARLVNHLERPIKLATHTLADDHPQQVFHRSAGVDVLPEVGDDRLVIELLTETVFQSALGETWRSGTDGVATAAPTTYANFHIVPARYDAGFIEVDRVSCMDCHDTVNRHVNDFEYGRDWYGRVRGSDGIFSLHPFDPSSVSHNGYSLPVRMNRRLVEAGIFQAFEARKHPATTYQKLLHVHD